MVLIIQGCKLAIARIDSLLKKKYKGGGDEGTRDGHVDDLEASTAMKVSMGGKSTCRWARCRGRWGRKPPPPHGRWGKPSVQTKKEDGERDGM